MSQTWTPDGAGRGHAPVRQRTRAASSASSTGMHPSYGARSVSDSATADWSAHGATVFDGGSRLMFEATANFGHTAMRVIYAGHVPKAA